MRKIAIVGAAIGAIAVAGVFGASMLVQHRAVSEVDAVFESLRASGVTASHGPVTFDYWTKSLSIADIALQAPGENGARTTIAKVHATGLMPMSNEMSAQSIEVSDFEIKSGIAKDLPGAYAHKAPKFIVSQFSAPAAFPATSSTSEILHYLARVKATSIVAPQGEVVLELPQPFAVKGVKQSAFTYTYTNLELKNLHEGRIGQLLIGKLAMTGGQAAVPVTNEMNKYASSDIDVMAMMSLYGLPAPVRPLENGYVRVQGKTTMGTYTANVGSAMTMTVDAMSSGEVGIDLKKVNASTIAELAKLIPQPGPPPNSAKAAEIAEKIASIYEGLKFADLEMRGTRVSMANSKDAAVSFGLIRLAGFEKGRLAEFALNDTSMNVPGRSPIKIGYAAVSGLDFAKMMRVTAEIGGGATSPEKSMQLLSALEGFEIRDCDVPDMATGKLKGRIEAMKATWGRFANGLPQVTRLTMKVQGAADGSEPALAFLQPMGLPKVWITYDIGTTWSEDAKAIVAEPMGIDVENVGAFSAKATLKSSSGQPLQLTQAGLAAAFQNLEVGPVTMKFRDAGLVRVYQAKMSGMAVAGGLKPDPIVELRQRLASEPVPNVAMITVIDAVSRFVDKPGQSLSLMVTPRSRVLVNQLTAPEASTTPEGKAALLDLFTLEAAVGL